MKTEIKWNCDGCGKKVDDRSPITDFRGNIVGFFGVCCTSKVNAMLDQVRLHHGAFKDDNGNWVASPRNTPSISSYDELVKITSSY